MSGEIEVVSTQAGYDRWAEVYDDEDNPLVRLEEKHLPALLAGGARLKWIDLGCGTGRHGLRLAAAGADVTAVDFSAAMLARARLKPGAEKIRFLHHDLSQRLPFPDAGFDRLLCSLVLDHIQDTDAFFGECKRLCSREGKILMSVMHPAMLLKGVQARFIEPGSGRRVGPASYPHQISDYLMSAVRAGLLLDSINEFSADEGLAAESPRARRYVGWPLLLLMQFTVA